MCRFSNQCFQDRVLLATRHQELAFDRLVRSTSDFIGSSPDVHYVVHLRVPMDHLRTAKVQVLWIRLDRACILTSRPSVREPCPNSAAARPRPTTGNQTRQSRALLDH